MKTDRQKALSNERNRRYRLKHKAKCAAYAKAYRDAHKRVRLPEPTGKKCRRCGEDKSKDAFYPVRRVTGARPTRGALGVESICKVCRSRIRNPSLAQSREAQASLRNSGRKQCGTCRAVKPFAEFAIRKASNDGRSYTCLTCSRLRSAEWKAANPGAFAAWYQSNKSRQPQRWAQWKDANKEHLKQSYKKWAQKNRDRVNARVMQRTLAKIQATPQWANHHSIRALYREAIRLTDATGVKHEVDHIVPLRSQIVCGLHVEHNLQVLPWSENRSKGNRHQSYHANDALLRANDSASDSMNDGPDLG